MIHEAVENNKTAFTKFVKGSCTNKLLNTNDALNGLFTTKRTPNNEEKETIHAIGLTTIGYPSFSDVEYCTPINNSVDTANRRNNSGKTIFRLFPKNVVTFIEIKQ